MNFPFRRRLRVPRRRLSERETNPASAGDNVFKRNRTLVGTTSNRLDSTGAKPGLESSRKHVHTLSIRRRKVFSTLVVVILSTLLIWTLISNFTVSSHIALNDLSIIHTVDRVKYEKVIQDYLDVNPTNRLSFFLDNKALNQFVEAKLPEVLNVSQRNMAGVGITNFALTLRKPVAGWKINGKQYYVDSSGIQFEINYFAVPGVQIVDQSGISNTPVSSSTTAIASKRFLSFVGQVVSSSKAYGYTITEAILPANMTRELEIKIGEIKSHIKLTIDRPAGEQIEDMDNAIKYFSQHNNFPEYIDVRVSGKAFYK